MEHIATQLIAAREARGLELLDVFIQTKKRVTKATLSRMENAKYPINIFLLMELAMFYNKPLSFFLPEMVWHPALKSILIKNSNK